MHREETVNSKKTALDWVKSMGLRTVCPLREKKRKEKALNCQATVHIYSTKALPRAFPRPLLKRLNQPIVLSSWTFRTEGNPTLLQTRWWEPECWQRKSLKGSTSTLPPSGLK